MNLDEQLRKLETNPRCREYALVYALPSQNKSAAENRAQWWVWAKSHFLLYAYTYIAEHANMCTLKEARPHGVLCRVAVILRRAGMKL